MWVSAGLQDDKSSMQKRAHPALLRERIPYMSEERRARREASESRLLATEGEKARESTKAHMVAANGTNRTAVVD